MFIMLDPIITSDEVQCAVAAYCDLLVRANPKLSTTLVVYLRTHELIALLVN